MRPLGQWIYETSGAQQFSRTGIAAELPDADGAHWEVTVKLGAYSSRGDTEAQVSGPKSYLQTAAKLLWEPGGLTSNDVTEARAWLLCAILSGTMSAPVDTILPDVSADELRSGPPTGST